MAEEEVPGKFLFDIKDSICKNIRYYMSRNKTFYCVNLNLI